MNVLPYSELIHVDESLWILAAETDIPIYDFRFDQCFPCRRPLPAHVVTAVGRIGAISNYPATFDSLLDEKIRLCNSPVEYRRCSELPGWYPLIEELTPKSIVFDEPPDADEVSQRLGWPVFVKGERQTSRHRLSLSVVADSDSFREAMKQYRTDPVLRWQKIVCRQFVPLRKVEDVGFDRLPSSVEFRTFWWRRRLVGFGPYWWGGRRYSISGEERAAAEAIAQEAANRVDVPFLVVDVAQRVDGDWIVIECNDDQESGYAGVSPIGLWQKIIAVELERSGATSDIPGKPGAI